MERLPVEIKFAQNLAGNEAKTRNKAVKKLKKYLRAKSASKKDGFSDEDFLKLWKGLHYCMWMQDKPLLQEELSTTLTSLVHDLSTVEAQMLFIKVFFTTEAREWHSIDIWRLDKFMMMVRNMLNQSLVLVKKLKWDKNRLDDLAQIFHDAIMNPDSDNIPSGLKIHFCDIYLDEVEKVGEGQLTGSQFLQLVVPFIKFMQKAKDGTLIKRMIAHVFDPIITRLADEHKLNEKQNDDADAEEMDEIPYRTLKIDGKLISEYIFRVSQEDCVLTRNRPIMYGLVKKLQDVEQDALPVQKEIVISNSVTGHDVRAAVNTLMNLEKIKDGKKKSRKKKNKKQNINEDSGGNENADPNNNRGSEENTGAIENQSSSTSNIGKKRKHSQIGDVEPFTKMKKGKLAQENELGDSSNEKKTFKKLKNKFSKLDVKKGKKDKKLQQANKEEAKSNGDIEQVSEKLSKKVEKLDKNKKENNSESKNIPKVVTVSAEVPSSFKKHVDKKSPDTLKKKGKRTHSLSTTEGNLTNGQVNTPVAKNSSAVPSVTVQKATPLAKSGTLASKSSVDNGDLQDGEVEIWIPNKKYKGNQDTNVTPKTNFATFDQSKPPVAFVKRSLSKSLKKTPSAMKTPTSAGSMAGSAKRVSFDMKKNKAQGFKESLSSPMTPYNPTKQPDSSILKSPGSALASKGPKKVVAKFSNNATPETPVTRQAANKVVGKKRNSTSTPVVTIGFEKKKTTPARRKKAADFFL